MYRSAANTEEMDQGSLGEGGGGGENPAWTQTSGFRDRRAVCQIWFVVDETCTICNHVDDASAAAAAAARRKRRRFASGERNADTAKNPGKRRIPEQICNARERSTRIRHAEGGKVIYRIADKMNRMRANDRETYESVCSRAYMCGRKCKTRANKRGEREARDENSPG